MSFIITNKEKLFLDDKYLVIQIDDLYFYYLKESNTILRHNVNSVFIYRGYFGNDNSHNQGKNEEDLFISNLNDNLWPMSDNWAGSFTFVYYDIQTKAFRIGNDAIGIYPCYYQFSNETISISDSLLLIAKTIDNPQIDDVGVFQRMVYEYSNIGSRTIIKGLKSLLPGELIEFSTTTFIITKKYDDSLYGEMLYNDLQEESIKKVFNKISFEYKKASERFTSTHIALSGGMDSRLILGLVNPNKVGICLTYGAEDFYETKVAKKLAFAFQFKFQNFYKSSDLWPTFSELNKIQTETESLTIGVWNTILKNIQPDRSCNVLLGDMCESLPGRNIKSFSSRDSRIKRFINSILLNKRVKFTPVNSESFELWAENKINNFKRMLRNSEVFKESFDSRDQLIEECISDLKDIMFLIKQHKIPFIELFDEIFEWYIHARLPMGKQVTIFNSHFDGQCPSMGLMALRNVSKIHPSLRVDYHFMDKIFKTMEVYKPAKHIPTLQSPFLPYYFPNYLRLMVWGIRNKIDQFLIRRMVRNKNYKLRFRLLKSINSAELYHEKQSEKIIEEYFNNDNFKLKDIALRRYYRRNQLLEWPLSNNDIISLASLNLDLNYIFKKN